MRTFGSRPGHRLSRYRGSGRKWMAISAESAARALPERRVNGTPAHRGLSTSTVREAYVSVLRRGRPRARRRRRAPPACRSYRPYSGPAPWRCASSRPPAWPPPADPQPAPRGTSGVDARWLFHQDQRHGLHQMVLYHVFHGAGGVVVGGPAFEGEAFQPADVDPLDVHGVPDRLEDPVEEPQGDDPADELAGQEVVDPEDHRLGQLDAQDLVEVPRGGQVGAEGFLDRDRVRGAQAGCR